MGMKIEKGRKINEVVFTCDDTSVRIHIDQGIIELICNGKTDIFTTEQIDRFELSDYKEMKVALICEREG